VFVREVLGTPAVKVSEDPMCFFVVGASHTHTHTHTHTRTLLPHAQGFTATTPAASCKEISTLSGTRLSGVYFVNPQGVSTQVFCDMQVRSIPNCRSFFWLR
jgi:hypothetical protein